MEIIKREPRSLTNPAGYEKVEKIDVKSPTILCLSGDGTRDSRDANGYAKGIASLLGVGETILPGHTALDGIDIYSVVYGGNGGISMMFDEGYCSNLFKSYLGLTTARQTPYKEGNKIEAVVDQLYDKIFKSMIFDENGEILPEEQISKNFSNLTVVDYCAGSIVMLGLEQKIYNDLKSNNISEEGCNQILKNLCTISMAPIVPLGRTRTSTVYLASAQDDEIRNLNGKRVTEEVDNSDIGNLAQYETVKNYPNNSCLVVCDAFGEDNEDEHWSGFYFKKTPGMTDEGRNLQMCFSYALSSMYEREGVVDTDALAENLRDMMNGSLQNAQSRAAQAVQATSCRSLTEEEYARTVRLNKKFTDISQTIEDIAYAKRVPSKSNFAKTFDRLKQLNNPSTEILTRAIDTLKRETENYNKTIKAQREELATKHFASEEAMLDAYKDLLATELKKWKMVSSTTAMMREIAQCEIMIEGEQLPSERLIGLQYGTKEKFIKCTSESSLSQQKQLSSFIEEHSKDVQSESEAE